MSQPRFRVRILPVLSFLSYPGGVSAQVAGSDGSPASRSGSDWGSSIALLAVVVALLLVIGGFVKLYDAKRKREDEALSLQARISDTLLRDFGALPVTVVVSSSSWRRSPVVVSVTGSVPTPELRETVMRAVHQELSQLRSEARAEDRLVVDPLVGRERVGTSLS